MGFLSSFASMGTMGLGGLGSTINDITGASASAAQAQRYAVANAKLNNKFQKEFAQNAHQWEMADLKAAGLNPALTATGGSGASASGGGSFGGSTGTPAGNPFDILNSIIGIQNQTSATKSQNALNRAQAIKLVAETDNIPYKNKIAMIEALAKKEQAEASTTNANTNKKALKYQDMNAQSNWRNSISNKYLSDAQIENLRKQGTVIKGGLPSKWFGTWWHDF